MRKFFLVMLSRVSYRHSSLSPLPISRVRAFPKAVGEHVPMQSVIAQALVSQSGVSLLKLSLSTSSYWLLLVPSGHEGGSPRSR